jgi:hypothetical protein
MQKYTIHYHCLFAFKDSSEFDGEEEFRGVKNFVFVFQTNPLKHNSFK